MASLDGNNTLKVKPTWFSKEPKVCQFPTSQLQSLTHMWDLQSLNIHKDFFWWYPRLDFAVSRSAWQEILFSDKTDRPDFRELSLVYFHCCGFHLSVYTELVLSRSNLIIPALLVLSVQLWPTEIRTLRVRSEEPVTWPCWCLADWHQSVAMKWQFWSTGCVHALCLDPLCWNCLLPGPILWAPRCRGGIKLKQYRRKLNLRVCALNDYIMHFLRIPVSGLYIAYDPFSLFHSMTLIWRCLYIQLRPVSTPLTLHSRCSRWRMHESRPLDKRTDFFCIWKVGDSGILVPCHVWQWTELRCLFSRRWHSVCDRSSRL